MPDFLEESITIAEKAVISASSLSTVRNFALPDQGGIIPVAGTGGVTPALDDAILALSAGGAWQRSLASAVRDLFLPAGLIMQYGGSAAPAGWLECDGSAVSRTTYAALYTAIGTTFGAGNGTTTFNLPDFRRRVPVGKGGTGTATLGNATGNTGGAETHTLATTEIPAHNHPVNNGVQQVGGGVSGTGANVTTGGGGFSLWTITTANAGGGGAHNNLPPSLVTMFIVKT